MDARIVKGVGFFVGGIMLTNAVGAAAAGKAVAEWDRGERPTQVPMLAFTATGTGTTSATSAIVGDVQTRDWTLGRDIRFTPVQEQHAPRVYIPRLAGRDSDLANALEKLYPKG